MNNGKRVVFVGAAQNCAANLPAVLANIDKMASLFSEAAFIFIENDSVDQTKQVMWSWGRSKARFQFINMDGLNAIPVRTLRLEMARNVCVEAIRATPALHAFDLVCILDMDDANARPIEVQALGSAIDFLGADSSRAAVFANQLGTYYDIWAFRHPQLCPHDVWESVLDYAQTNGVSDDVAFGETFAKCVRSFAPNGEPIEVDSAFGGLGIYKMQFVLNNHNPYLGSKVKVRAEAAGKLRIFRMQVCEHVHFNRGMAKQGGKLFVMPSLINAENNGMSFPSSAYRRMVF